MRPLSYSLRQFGISVDSSGLCLLVHTRNAVPPTAIRREILAERTRKVGGYYVDVWEGFIIQM
jgi:hypothetical protein